MESNVKSEPTRVLAYQKARVLSPEEMKLTFGGLKPKTGPGQVCTGENNSDGCHNDYD